jgi:hypothetical protein
MSYDSITVASSNVGHPERCYLGDASDGIAESDTQECIAVVELPRTMERSDVCEWALNNPDALTEHMSEESIEAEMEHALEIVRDDA